MRQKNLKKSWSRVVSDINSACSHRGAGLRPYGPEAAISAVKLLYVTIFMKSCTKKVPGKSGPGRADDSRQ
jgi:hypothetical protein